MTISYPIYLQFLTAATGNAVARSCWLNCFFLSRNSVFRAITGPTHMNNPCIDNSTIAVSGELIYITLELQAVSIATELIICYQ
jgi:hypothetical protein